MKCHACKSTAIYIDGLCESCYNDLRSGSDDATMVAEKLVSVIAAKDARIAELEAQIERTRQSREYRTNLLLTSMDKSSARIAELEAQLAAALATIERAL
jgi:hypothetical protein